MTISRTYEKCISTKGIVFLMIRFKTLDEVYLLPYSKFQRFWKRYKDNIKKS